MLKGKLVPAPSAALVPGPATSPLAFSGNTVTCWWSFRRCTGVCPWIDAQVDGSGRTGGNDTGVPPRRRRRWRSAGTPGWSCRPGDRRERGHVEPAVRGLVPRPQRRGRGRNVHAAHDVAGSAQREHSHRCGTERHVQAGAGEIRHQVERALRGGVDTKGSATLVPVPAMSPLAFSGTPSRSST